MHGKWLLVLERCLGCQALFLICRSCYHGQVYCGDACRKRARAAQVIMARAKHQATPHGRDDHRDRNRALRGRSAPITSVMDQGSEILAPSSSVCLPQGPSAPMSGAVEVERRNDDDADPTDCSSEN